VRRVPFLDAGAVQQDRDAVLVLEDGGHEGADGFGGRQVRGVDCCFAA